MPEKLIISCKNLKPEMDSAISDSGETLKSIYLDQDLHRHPENIKGEIERVLMREEEPFERVILGYGLCSNGVVGLRSEESDIIVPRIHDCIGLYLGSLKRYMENFRERPGTYYLTPGWIELRRDPLTTMEKDYTELVGREAAEEAMFAELRNYTRLAYIDTGVRENSDLLRNKAEQNAAYFNLEYEELKGDLSFLRKLVSGPYERSEFVIAEKGFMVKQSMFFSE
ncbi:MAG: DUF1638 domain-containing protein [Chitinivibrionales bacterium]